MVLLKMEKIHRYFLTARSATIVSVCVCVKKANSLYCIEERRQDGWLSACCVPLSLWVKLWFHVKIKLFLKNFRVAWNHV